MKLQGKTVLVTGGTKGIGRAVVERMAQEGANVVINYANDEAAAKQTEKALAKYKVNTLCIKADIGNRQDVDRMFAEIKKVFSDLDVLVNNYGAFNHEDGPDNVEAFEELLHLNVASQVYVTNKARELMPKGKIIFLSSIHGELGHGRPGAIAYSASKAALNSYMKNLAKVLAPDILVNSVAPGRTLTPMWGDMTEEYKAKQAEGHLTNRWIKPEEIADGVAFLIGNDSVCGEVLTIDGGMGLKTF